MITAWIMWGLTGALAPFGLVIVIVFCTRAALQVQIDTEAVPRARVKMTLLSGLVRLPAFAILGNQSVADRARKKIRPPKRAFGRWRSLQNFRAATRLVTSIWNRLDIKLLEADIDFGFEDPAETGLVYGLTTPLIYAGARCNSGQLHIRPDFSGEILRGQGALVISMVPVALVAPLAVFAWSVFASPRRGM